ncbi:MAG TPA: NAD(P)/FAD-dependent oxidoreductase [Thermomicrobiales bacterium]|nr:NAD(P)/FAD-dependent oxidoreductase [Thermomicrobiales bacterium]
MTPNGKTDADVAIVGGGVAGSTMGAVLARAGLNVIVIEREAEFRDKVRGEGIHPWGYREAKRLGLDSAFAAAGAVELPVWQTYTNRVPDEPSLWAEDQTNGLPEVTVFHPALQDALLAYAAEQGARIFRPAQAISLYPGRPSVLDVRVDDRRYELAARLVIGADGRTSQVRKWIGARTESDPMHHMFGGARLAGADLPEGATHGTTFPGGRMFAFPQGNGFARAYLVGQPELLRPLQGATHRDAYVEFCASVLPSGILDNASPVGPVAFFPNNDIWSSNLAAEQVILIGDAAGANDPSVGQGLSLVFRDVRILSDLLLNERDWPHVIHAFAEQRTAYFDVLRQHAKWFAQLLIDTGPSADALRAQVAHAREQDPTAGGFATIFSRGPDGLVADEPARRHFFGEDLSVR